MKRSSVLRALGLAAGAAVVGRLLFRSWLRRSLPPVRGELRLPGLAGRVEVRRDLWGVAHLTADNEADLFFAQGFVHASDRLWQMEMYRRAGAGRIAELVGERGLELDRFVRRVGIRRAATAEWDAMEPEPRAGLAAYAAGVNACLELRRPRPVEFQLLRFYPEPWSPVDSLVWAKVMAFSLSPNFDTELVRTLIVERAGPDAAAALEPEYGRDFPTAASDYSPPPGGGLSAAEDVLSEFAQLAGLVGIRPGAGSNAWVAGPQRTATGRPLLANDPHLAPQAPSLWYEIHLTGGGLDVIGCSLPGLPGVVIGHNRRIAWGITAGLADVQDLCVERLNLANPTQYWFRGEWRQGRIVREEIRVRGRREPVIEDVLITHHGPLIDPALPGGRWPLALRSAVLEPSPGTISAGLRLMRAETWTEFLEAVGDWAAPTQNFVYADVDGNVGYAFAGKVPMRGQGTGLLPVPGWDGEHEWLGYIPPAELPRTFNPDSGYIATANNRPVPLGYPHFLGREWQGEYRARRIGEVLEARHDHDVRSFRSLQLDTYSLPGRELQDILRTLESSDPQARLTLRVLLEWDGDLRADSAGGGVYEVLRWLLLRRIATAAFADLGDLYLGSSPIAGTQTHLYAARLTSLLFRLLRGERGPLPGGIDRDRLVEESLATAAKYLTATLGSHPERWDWGRLHKVTMSHVLGHARLLHRLFDRGPFPIDGDADTVMQTGCHAGTFGAAARVPSYRLIVDLADFDRSLAVLPGGQSGHPGSSHYDDQLRLWRRGEYHPLLFSGDAIRGATEDLLILEPERPG